MAHDTPVECQECGTALGGDSGKDTYSHMLHCLKVAPGPLERIREAALGARNENGKRVVHLVDAMLSSAVSVNEEA